MDTLHDQVREQQRESWNKFSGGWKKWDDFVINKWLRPVGDELLNAVTLDDDYDVLDVACGTGEPGLTAAPMVRNGSVTGTDIAEDMVAIADENARQRGLTNFRTVVADASSLPF